MFCTTFIIRKTRNKFIINQTTLHSDKLVIVLPILKSAFIVHSKLPEIYMNRLINCQLVPGFSGYDCSKSQLPVCTLSFLYY